MMDVVLVKAAGAFDIGLGIFHLCFARLFNWKHALPRLDPVNRGIYQVENLMLIVLFFLVGVALILQAGGHRAVNMLLLGGAIFWTIRTALQPLYWSLRSTFAKVMLVVFALGASLHALPWFLK